MTTITSTTGKKAVNISTDGAGNVNAMYVQICEGTQQVLQAKQFASESNAVKWANKILS